MFCLSENISQFVCLFTYWASFCTVTNCFTTHTQRGQKGRSSGRVLGVDLKWFINLVYLFCLFVCLFVGLVSALLSLIHSKRTMRKEFRKNTWSWPIELNLKYITVGHKRTVILRDEANWCTSKKVIAKKAWPTFILPSPINVENNNY